VKQGKGVPGVENANHKIRKKRRVVGQRKSAGGQLATSGVKEGLGASSIRSGGKKVCRASGLPKEKREDKKKRARGSSMPKDLGKLASASEQNDNQLRELRRGKRKKGKAQDEVQGVRSSVRRPKTERKNREGGGDFSQNHVWTRAVGTRGRFSGRPQPTTGKKKEKCLKKEKARAQGPKGAETTVEREG